MTTNVIKMQKYSKEFFLGLIFSLYSNLIVITRMVWGYCYQFLLIYNENGTYLAVKWVELKGPKGMRSYWRPHFHITDFEKNSRKIRLGKVFFCASSCVLFPLMSVHL